jgi:hypothetical protein
MIPSILTCDTYEVYEWGLLFFFSLRRMDKDGTIPGGVIRREPVQ